MKGSVTKYTISGSSRPRWRFRIYVGKDASGRKRYEGHAGFEKEAEAAKAMRGQMKELSRPREAPKRPAPEDTAVGDWLNAWIQRYATERCTSKTIERYHQLAGYITQAPSDEVAQLARTPLSALKPDQVESALYGLLHAPARRRARISVTTLRHVAGVLHGAFNKAFKLGLITVNPMLLVDLPPAKRPDARALSDREVRALRDVCRGDWTFVLVELALATGARRGELLAATWNDVDSIARTLTIRKSLEQTAAGLRVKAPKSGKSRVCLLPHAALVALQFQREQQADCKRKFGADFDDHDLIFCRPDGHHLRPDLVSQVIVRRMRKAGITQASMHSLRHTHASTLLSHGIPLPAVSARLGHSDQTTTLRIYSHAMAEDDRRAADAWDRVIDGPLQ